MTDAAVETNVIATRQGRMGHLLLNRPRALNALDPAMIGAIAASLAEWRDDPAVQGVVIEGAGGRAFCAGGDIRNIRTLAMEGAFDRIAEFFAEEYALNGMIAEYPKPYIALIDGICLGGGIGVSVHGRFRVTTESGLFAMPETAIGFFPDVGTSYVLPRLPGALGIYLGLTGTRLANCDAVHAGIATHYVPAQSIPALRASIFANGASEIAVHAHDPAPFSLAPHRAAIDRCFGAPDVPGIVAALQAEQSDWARETLATLRTMSPTAVMCSFENFRRGAASDLRTCLHTELALSRKVTAHSDFTEGVRAMVVDKDRQPRWNPARIEDVDPAAIAAMFSAS
ncbi:MAG TPA: enoyl-CoA hydratase/isomerase family protein [Acetobacteraceae bacterium]|jgi:enoyl-CoA hydratase